MSESFHCFRYHMWCVALLLSLCAGPKFCRAQTAFPPSSHSQTLTVPPAPRTTLAATHTPNGQLCCDTNYWIVSTRRCPQKSGKRCIGCQLDHFHYNGNRCEFQKDARAFHNWLKPGVPTCIIVHGSFVSFNGLLQETRQMARWIRAARPGQPLNIVYLTWPSDGAFTGLFQYDILMLGRRSAFNGFYLAQLISTLPEETPISLIGHSHGARIVSSAMHLLGGGMVQGYRLYKPGDCSRRLRVVFLAAAIDHHWLNPGERYGRALCRSEAVLNVRNHSDLALFFYPLRRPFSRTSLARKGFTKNDLAKIGNGNAKITEIDATKLIGRRHFWQYYFLRPEIAQVIAPYIFYTNSSPSDTNRTPSHRNVLRQTKFQKPKPQPRWHRTQPATSQQNSARKISRR